MNTKKTETTENNETASVCPAGEAFPLPREEDYKAEFDRISALAAEQCVMGRENSPLSINGESRPKYLGLQRFAIRQNSQ